LLEPGGQREALPGLGSVEAVVIDENDPAEKGTLPQLRTFNEHSLTRGSNFGELVDPLLLTFSPGALGYVFNWMPHALIFLSGMNGSLVAADSDVHAAIEAAASASHELLLRPATPLLERFRAL
jgi:hypothetical protein